MRDTTTNSMVRHAKLVMLDVSSILPETTHTTTRRSATSACSEVLTLPDPWRRFEAIRIDLLMIPQQAPVHAEFMLPAYDLQRLVHQ